MRVTRTGLVGAALVAGCLLQAARVGAEAYEQRSAVQRAAYTSVAMIANVVPVVSALFAPQCLPGYLVCKITFAGVSLLAAADVLALSGGGDMRQTRALLHRGFAGDWFLTGKHIAGDLKPQPLPEAPPPVSEGGGGWEPPPR